MSEEKSLEEYYKREEWIISAYKVHPVVNLIDWLQDVLQYYIGGKIGADTSRLAQVLVNADVYTSSEESFKDMTAIRSSIMKEIENLNKSL